MAISYGTTESDTLQGGTGNDSLYGGGGGVDQFYGGAGNDTYFSDSNYAAFIYNSPGMDTAYGGSGQEHFYYSSMYSPVLDGETLYGGEGEDQLNINFFTNDYDDFWFDARPDKNGLGHGTNGLVFSGIDVFDISTGNGNDSIALGDTDDYVFTGLGNDTIIGGGGIDTLRGSFDDDLIYGGDGDDSLDGDQGDGSYGNDRLYGGAGADLVAGSGGDDILWGDDGEDALYGGEGQDTLRGGRQQDTLNGGKGDDVYVLARAAEDATDTIVEFAGQGTDEVQAAFDFTLSDFLENLTFTGTASLAGIGNHLDNRLKGNIGNNRIDGQAGNDVLAGDKGKDTLVGGIGNDTLDGGVDGDVMSGGVGDDLYMMDAADDIITEIADQGRDTIFASVSAVLSSNVENLTLLGTSTLNGTGNTLGNVIAGNAGNNRLDGLAGKDTINGGIGNDVIDGGTDDDWMTGGEGDDVYCVDSVKDVVVESRGQGIDKIESSVTSVLTANVENLTLLGTSALNGTGNTFGNVIAGNAGNNRLGGLAGNDTINGEAGNDVIDGGTGDDRMGGGAGNDIYRVDSTKDIVFEFGGQGIDKVESSVSTLLGGDVENLTLLGTFALNGTGNTFGNVIAGNASNNRLNGLAGNDTISGGAGNDVIDGGIGIDRMAGGVGNDIYRVDSAKDIVVESAKQGVDKVETSVSTALGGNVENLALLGTSALNGTGNTLSNVISGNAGNNRLGGLAGNDTINGGLGDDVINGHIGNDHLAGSAGDDRLVGGAGLDRLTGGTGADNFVFVTLKDSTGNANGRDVITDFKQGQHDLINLSLIDASLNRAGNQSFSYIGDAKFSGNAGELSARMISGGTLISADVNGDKIADLSILLDDRLSLGIDSFLL